MEIQHIHGTKQYKHVLKPFVPYSEEIKNSDMDIYINYTLDSYIKIYGNIGTEYIKKDGYLINTDNYDITSGTIKNLTYKDKDIEIEELSEKIAWKDLSGTINKQLENYVYDKDNNKIYFDFNPFLVDKDNIRQDLSNNATELVGTYYKKIAVPVNNSGKWEVKYYYQALNRKNIIFYR